MAYSHMQGCTGSELVPYSYCVSTLFVSCYYCACTMLVKFLYYARTLLFPCPLLSTCPFPSCTVLKPSNFHVLTVLAPYWFHASTVLAPCPFCACTVLAQFSFHALTVHKHCKFIFILCWHPASYMPLLYLLIFLLLSSQPVRSILVLCSTLLVSYSYCSRSLFVPFSYCAPPCCFHTLTVLATFSFVLVTRSLRAHSMPLLCSYSAVFWHPNITKFIKQKPSSSSATQQIPHSALTK